MCAREKVWGAVWVCVCVSVYLYLCVCVGVVMQDACVSDTRDTHVYPLPPACASACWHTTTHICMHLHVRVCVCVCARARAQDVFVSAVCVQDGDDPQDTLSSYGIFRKRALQIVALLRRETWNLRHHMHFRHPVYVSWLPICVFNILTPYLTEYLCIRYSDSLFDYLFVYSIFWLTIWLPICVFDILTPYWTTYLCIRYSDSLFDWIFVYSIFWLPIWLNTCVFDILTPYLTTYLCIQYSDYLFVYSIFWLPIWLNVCVFDILTPYLTEYLCIRYSDSLFDYLFVYLIFWLPTCILSICYVFHLCTYVRNHDAYTYLCIVNILTPYLYKSICVYSIGVHV